MILAITAARALFFLIVLGLLFFLVVFLYRATIQAEQEAEALAPDDGRGRRPPS